MLLPDIAKVLRPITEPIGRMHSMLNCRKSDSLVQYPGHLLAVKSGYSSQVWWCMTIFPALGRLRQEDHEFKASLSYMASLRSASLLYLKKTKQNKTTKNQYNTCQD
jgi:hypothetical protein